MSAKIITYQGWWQDTSDTEETRGILHIEEQSMKGEGKTALYGFSEGRNKQNAQNAKYCRYLHNIKKHIIRSR